MAGEIKKLFYVSAFAGNKIHKLRVEEIEDVKETAKSFKFHRNGSNRVVPKGRLLFIDPHLRLFMCNQVMFFTYCYEEDILKAKEAILRHMRTVVNQMKQELAATDIQLNELERIVNNEAHQAIC